MTCLLIVVSSEKFPFTIIFKGCFVKIRFSYTVEETSQLKISSYLYFVFD